MTKIAQMLVRFKLKIDFSCRVCGKDCDVAPDYPDRAICPECCDTSEEGHDYVYVRGERAHLCYYCGQERPNDWYD